MGVDSYVDNNDGTDNEDNNDGTSRDIQIRIQNDMRSVQITRKFEDVKRN